MVLEIFDCNRHVKLESMYILNVMKFWLKFCLDLKIFVADFDDKKEFWKIFSWRLVEFVGQWK
jgi:hypothetical protein